MEEKKGYKKGLWTVEEDRILLEYVRVHGKGRWNRMAQMSGLKRCGKSCRLRWMNYLSPSIKRGGFSEEEDDLIIRLHNLLGNRECESSQELMEEEVLASLAKLRTKHPPLVGCGVLKGGLRIII